MPRTSPVVAVAVSVTPTASVPAVAAAAGLQAELATIDPGLDLKAIVPAFEALQKKDKELERRLEEVDHLLKDMASRRDFQGRGGAATTSCGAVPDLERRGRTSTVLPSSELSSQK